MADLRRLHASAALYVANHSRLAHFSTLTPPPLYTPPPKDEALLVARTTQDDTAKILEAAIPQSVRDAMLNPGAAKSVAEAFSGEKVPDWFETIPNNIKQMYQTATESQTSLTTSILTSTAASTSTMTSTGAPQIVIPASEYAAYKSMFSKSAVHASHLSESAAKFSSNAEKYHDAAEQTLAQNIFRLAAGESSAVASNLADFKEHYVSGSSPLMTTSFDIAFDVSMIAAVACLVLALAL